MSNESVAAQKLPDTTIETVTGKQVAAYLSENPDFFLSQQELLADLTLPHESGKAVSLLERQVTLLRDRNYTIREQLGNLLENASKNDQIFEITRNLVLALLRAKSIEELVGAVRKTFIAQENIDACELILASCYGTSSGVNMKSELDFSVLFADVFRLEHTHCGKPIKSQLECLFGDLAESVKSTALCPIMMNGRQLGILAIASRERHYFNVNLDTLFLDFIGNVIAVILEGHLPRKHVSE